ncbi:ORF6C domain-containing protein [Oscillochloris sp. ZM17-4]|uniref:phage antirepressor N-terminal domain-containing protein n=1 Tax=Oscillochloris sp. ZM17-4 TaxID=2866714 RepID=UPI001C72FCF8|nr:ORF6C domain-containing protein [Oscillochloris sp. ZM17-4]
MTDLPDLPQRPVRVERQEFAGDVLVAAVLEGEGVAVPVRMVCNALGLDPEAQSAALREHDVLSQGLRVVRVPVEGRVRSVLALMHTYLAFWLATIQPNMVAAAVRPKLVRYQEELVDVLHVLYGPNLGDAAPTLDTGRSDAVAQQLAARDRELRTLRAALLDMVRAQRESTAQIGALAERVGGVEDLVQELRQIAKISAVQAEYLQRAIKRLATRYKQASGTERNMYELLFAQFKMNMGIPRYDALPAGKYDQALAWLRAKAQELLPDDPEALPPLQEQLL